MVPLVFPLVEPHEGLTFWNAFFRILSKVFPLLLSPLFGDPHLGTGHAKESQTPLNAAWLYELFMEYLVTKAIG